MMVLKYIPKRRCFKQLGWLALWSVLFYAAFEAYDYANKEYGNAGALNYFLKEEDYGKLKYLIETPNCKIIKMSPYDNAILSFIKPKISPPDCKAQNPRHWTFLDGWTIHMNKTAIQESGYSISSLHCCYRGILRVEKNLHNYDWTSDNEVRYSEDCIKMKESSTKVVEFEFIRVFCISSSWPFLGEVVYREFYPIALPKSEKVIKKINYWQNVIKKDSVKKLPPSVVMIGIDSLSRMNFHRSFNETNSFLKEIGAVEFLGYTKVGENTHPNTAAFLTGYEQSDLMQTCMKASDVPQDFCPYIWKRFSEANYLTATVEDAPGLVGFNYMKLGFVEKPTDFYFRPFMLAVHKSLMRKDYYHTDCIGRFTTEETLLNYIKRIMNYSSVAPVFVHSWMTSLAHLDINGARFADETVSKFLKSLDLSNTVLIFLSDHGQRYGAIRETLAGWYEDKLPILMIYLPHSLRKKFPSWFEALVENSQKLTSPFDLYKMISDILDNFTTSNPTPDETTSDGKIIPRKYGQSLFKPIANSRSCKDAGIRINYCACLPPSRLNLSDPNLLAAAKAAVAYLNSVIPSQCARASLSEISAGALMSNFDEEKTFIVTFYTNPGQFMFEANVDFNEGTNKFNVTTDLLRMNKIVRDAGCVSTSILERYCYCK